jgi:hypothetical protein
MLKWKKAATESLTQYATRTDFCQVFRNEANSLYLLSLLLTADHAKAEKCFARGLGGLGREHHSFQGVGSLPGPTRDY